MAVGFCGFIWDWFEFSRGLSVFVMWLLCVGVVLVFFVVVF